MIVPGEADALNAYLQKRKNQGLRVIGSNPVINELDKELIKSLPIIDRIRYAAPERVPQDVRRAAAETGFWVKIMSSPCKKIRPH